MLHGSSDVKLGYVKRKRVVRIVVGWNKIDEIL
jgi:hypothetical protein